MTKRMIAATAALLVTTGATWAQTGPSTSGAAGAAQSQGVTASPETAKPGATAASSGANANSATGLGATGGLGGTGAPGAPAAVQSTVPAPLPEGAKP